MQIEILTIALLALLIICPFIYANYLNRWSKKTTGFLSAWLKFRSVIKYVGAIFLLVVIIYYFYIFYLKWIIK